MKWCLAQVNAAVTCGTFDSPAMLGLTSRIQEMNCIAEASPGFCWRFKAGESDDFLHFSTYFENFSVDRLFFNMSVWSSVEALITYTYKTAHSEMVRNKKTWLVPSAKPLLAMWWIEEGKIPSVIEALERLQHLHCHGPTEHAFDFKSFKNFPPPRTP